MKRFRTVLFWCHLATGVTVGLVVLLMSVTGVLLTYQRQITTWADLRGLDGAPPAGVTTPLPLDELLRRVAPEDGPSPSAVVLRAGPDRPVQVSFGREKVVFANAYSGAVLGEGSGRVRGFFRFVTDWHRWLGRPSESRALGKAITGASNLAFLFLVVSGFYLWWPRRWSRAAAATLLRFRGGLSGKARDYNWHHVVGFWSALPLVVIVASGVVISYGWASDLVYRLAGESPPAPASRAAGAKDHAPAVWPAGLDGLVARARAQDPAWRTLTLSLPVGDSVRFTVDRGTGGQPQKRGQLTLDRETGDVLAWEPFASATPGRRARLVLRFAHTGEVLGIAGQTLAGVVTAAVAVLVWTGLALSLRRLVAWQRRSPRGPARTPRAPAPARPGRRPRPEPAER